MLRRLADSARTRGLARQGLEIPDALKLPERLDVKILTGDAIFCQKSVTAKIVERGGDYVHFGQGNQKALWQDIETAFNEPVFPGCTRDSCVEKAHGRIERRAIAVLPPAAARIEREWSTIGKSAVSNVDASSRKTASGNRCNTRSSLHLISSPRALPRRRRGWPAIAIIEGNRDHLHRNKDVILGQDGYTNRCDNAPRNIFSLTGFVLKILKSVSPSPTRAIERFQDNKNRAIRLFSGFH